jgi:hypothetical protein
MAVTERSRGQCSRGREKNPYNTENFRRVNIFDVYILNVNSKNDNKAFAQNFTEKFRSPHRAGLAKRNPCVI